MDTTLRETADEYFMRRGEDSFFVRRDGHSVGVLTLSDLKRVSAEEWPSRFVADVMEDLDDELSVGPDTPLEEALTKLQTSGLAFVGKGRR